MHEEEASNGNGISSEEQRPSVADLVADARELIADLDDVSPSEMNSLYYIHAYNELTLALRDLLDALDESEVPGPGACPDIAREGRT